MKKLLLLSFLLASSAHAQALFQMQKANGGGSSFTPTFSVAGQCATGTTSCGVTLSVTNGQFVVCGEGTTAASITLSCSDSDGDTITSAPSGSPFAQVTAGWTLAMFRGALTHTNASEVFTCTASSAEFALDCAIGVYSGTPTSGWDVALAGLSNNSVPGGASVVNSGTTTVTTNASELAVAFFMVNTSNTLVITQSGSWNLRTSNNTNVGFALVDQILVTTGAQTAAITATEGTGPNAAAGILSTIK
jgi:hypothetical protein